MRNNSLQIIKKLINDLPEGDLKFANKYINNRDFDSLELLVKSAIYNIRKGLVSSNLNDMIKYRIYSDNPNKLDNLLKLQTEVSAYNSMLSVILGDSDEDEPTGPYFDPDDYSEEDL